MSTVAATTWDQVADGMVAGLQALAIPQGGTPTTTAYLRVCKRYMGEKFDGDRAMVEGLANRCPGVLVAFAGERPFRTTIGRRRDRVEATFVAICVEDSRRSRDDRKAIFKVLGDVRRQIGDTKLGGLPIMPLRYGGLVVFAETDQLTAYGVRFITRYVVDYTIDPGTDTIATADGQIVYPTTNAAAPAVAVPAPAAPTLNINGSGGTQHYAYDVQATFASGPDSDFSPWTATSTAPVLGGGNSITVTWQAVAGASGYRLRRRWAPAGVSTGVIYTGALLTFTDDGSVVADGNVLPVRGLNYDGDFA